MSAGHAHDDWHQHTAAEGAPQEEHGAQASAKAMGLTLIAMVVGVVLTILVLVAYFKSYVGNFKAQKQEGTTGIMTPAFEGKLAAREKLSSYQWIDRDAKTVRVPIDAAMQTVLAEYKANQPSN